MKFKRLILYLLIFILSCNLVVYSEGLELSGSNYVLIDTASGRVLIGKDKDSRMPIASTTKIMTALVAIEKGDMNKKVLIDNDSAGVEGSSIYLENNEEIILEDLLYGLMLRSGNDAATAIAKDVGGSVEKFIELMNQKAKSINAKNTNFQNPHGLSEKNHYSSAYDLALITREALNNQLFSEIFSAKEYKAKREKNNFFLNKNKALWEYEGADGGKTGYTLESGRCLVSTASKKGLSLIAVSLNAYDWFNDNYKLLDYGFDNFKPYIIYSKSQLIQKTLLPNINKELLVMASKEFVYPIQEEERHSVKNRIIIYENLKTPIYKGDKVGTIETYIAGVLVKSDDLIAGNNIKFKLSITGLFDRILGS